MLTDSQVALTEAPKPADVPEATHHGDRGLVALLLSGSSALGAAMIIERGLGFVANLVAARLGGAHTFGAYSIAMTTANNVASYAGAGIGTTANRFSGEYPRGAPGYNAFLRALSVVSLASAGVASILLWIAAAPLAKYLLRNPGLTGLLRLAAASAGVIILLECLRGLLIGQRRFQALVSLGVLFGVGMLLALPLAARHGASYMILAQLGSASVAVVVCVLGARRFKFAPDPGSGSSGPHARAILRFGLVQLGSIIGLNASGWWIASLVARADLTLVQAACYSVATQMRNMSAMPASLVSQTAYAQLTERAGTGYGGAGRVTVLSTIAATVVSLLVAGPILSVIPWVVPHLYGKDFASAELAATFAVATGVLHMSAAPAAARLAVVSLSLTGLINGVWAVLVVAVGTWRIPYGGAAEATGSFLAAHTFSAIAVLVAVLWTNSVPRSLVAASLPFLVGSGGFAWLGWLRSFTPHKAVLSWAMMGLTCSLLLVCLQQARRSSPSLSRLSLRDLLTVLFHQLPFRRKFVLGRS